MIDLHMASPRPIPLGFVVWKGAKIVCILSGGMPLPVSETDTMVRSEFSGLVNIVMVRASTG